MVDFRVDDGFPNHPKTLGMTHEAMGVWLVMGCWCARYLTDGYIPGEALAQITKKQRIIDDLTYRNLITPLGDGWQLVDWLQYQRPKELILKERAEAKERMRELRAKRRGN